MKIKTLSLSIGCVLAFSLFLVSCVEDRVDLTTVSYTDGEYEVLSRTLNLPRERANYGVKLPRHMARLGATAPVVNSAKATLGAVLFYDTKLSDNNTVSCASCHKQSLAFSDDVALSKGFKGELTKRNSLALGSAPNFEVSYRGETSALATTAGFFWDERAHSIQEQSMMTLQDDIEMGMNLDELTERLENIAYYNILFTKAFGSGKVTPNRVTEALQHFINGFISGNSRFDEGLNQTGNPFAQFAEFTAQENLGKALYNTNCSGCHSADFTIAAETVANNGLDLEYADQGLGARSSYDFDNGKFKVPFLRNIALTGPYMHDGRFATLEEVIDHYSDGIKDHPNLDNRLKKYGGMEDEPVRMHFSEEEKAALLAFLHTLTDYQFIQDERYADPFK